MPKSVSFGNHFSCSSSTIRMFDGLMSLCSTPTECAAASARATFAMISSRVSSGRIDTFTQLNSGLSNDVVYGVSVEGELGCLGSLESGHGEKEDGHGAEGKLSHEQLLTNPDEAVKFVKETRVDAPSLRHEVSGTSLCPDRELLAGGGPERVAVRQAHLVPGAPEARRELADRRALPRPVHTDHHHDGEVAPSPDVEVVLPRQDLTDLLGEQLRWVVLRPVPLPHPLHDRRRSPRPQVGLDQHVLEALPFVVGRRQRFVEDVDSGIVDKDVDTSVPCEGDGYTSLD